jgi:glycosyltransferase involved in cell wall biosynthesis
MLSIIIATHNSEHALVRTLASLVPGAMAGLVSDVVVADGGSRDDTEAVADVAGCHFLTTEGPLARRLAAAVAASRGRWLLFLRPGVTLDPSWVAEAGRFIERPAYRQCAAVFQRGGSAYPALQEAFGALAAALGRRPQPEQGLVIGKEFYAALGGHVEAAADAEADLLRRIGRRRLVRLTTAASRTE